MPRWICSIICVIPIYGLYMCILVVTRTESILKCYWFCFLNVTVLGHLLLLSFLLLLLLLLLLYNITRDAIAHLTHYPLQFTHYCNVWNREQKFPESYKVAKTFRWTDTHTRAVNVYYDDIMMRLSRCSLIVLIKFLCKTISSPLTFSILSRRESNSTCCRYYIEVGGFFQTR